MNETTAFHVKFVLTLRTTSLSFERIRISYQEIHFIILSALFHISGKDNKIWEILYPTILSTLRVE